MNKQILGVGLVVAIALGLRLFGLSVRPAGFTWDEAALGYNAYSLLLTGKDEHGQVMPVVFKSFGDYKPGLYVYFAVPAIATLGLSEVATRVPSALFGSLLVLGVFFLVKETLGVRIGWLSSLILAINPWAIHFSRGAWEANLALLLAVLGAVMFVRKRLYLAAVLFGLSLWSYQGAKLFTPALILVLWLSQQTRMHHKMLIKPLLIFLAFIAPLAWGAASYSGRLKVYSAFSYHRSEDSVLEILHQDGTDSKNWSYYLWHSEIYDQLRGFVQRYTNHLSPEFLFFSGDWTNGRQSIPYIGYWYFPEIVTMLMGCYRLVKLRNRSNWLWWGWLLIAPLPAALSRDLVSGVRALPLVIPLCVLVAVGLSKLLDRRILTAMYLAAVSFFVVYWLDLYFIHAPHFTAGDWLVAYKPALRIVADQVNKYDQVIFTPQLGQPYIFTLFYLHIDPAKYQGQARLAESEVGDVGQVLGFDKFTFRPIYWPDDRQLNSTLFVGGQYELPEADLVTTPNVIRLGEVNYTNGTTALKVVGLP